MKFVTLILFFVCFSVAGQPKLLLSVPIEKDAIVLRGMPNTPKPFIGFYQNDSVSLYTVNANDSFSLTWAITLKKDNELEKIKNSKQRYWQLGSLLDSTNNFTECFYTKDKKDNFFFMTANSKQGVLQFSDTITLEKEEKLCSYFITDSSFILVTYFEKSDNIVIYQKKIGEKSKYFSYLIEHAGLGKRRNENYYRFSNYKKLKTISSLLTNPYCTVPSNVEYSLTSVLAPTKLYFQDNEFILAYENEELETTVYRFPLSDTILNVQTYKHLIDSGSKINKSWSICSSIIFDSTIAMVNINQEIFHVTFVNINSNSTIKSYRFDKKDTGSFIISDIHKKGNFWSGKSSNIINIKRMLERITYLDQSQMGLTVFKKDSAINIRIGGNYKRLDALGLTASISGGLVVGFSSLAGSLLGSFINGAASAFLLDETNTNLIYFDAAFDSNNFSSRDYSLTKSPLSSLGDFVKSNKPEKKSPSIIYQYGNSLIAGYTTENSNNLKIYKFN